MSCSSPIAHLYVGEVAELKPQARQQLCLNFFLSTSCELRQYPAVFSKDVVDVSNVRRRVAVKLIVPRRAAMIVTELLVSTANDALPAFHTHPMYFEIGHLINIDVRVARTFADPENQTPDTSGLPGIRTT
jgi:hypothetical protein